MVERRRARPASTWSWARAPPGDRRAQPLLPTSGAAGLPPVHPLAPAVCALTDTHNGLRVLNPRQAVAVLRRSASGGMAHASEL